MKLNGRPPKIVLESDVRRAMKHTLSNAQAAKFLGINKITYKKYASQYFDDDGISLYEKHCNPNGKGITRNHTVFRGNKYKLQDILDGIFANEITGEETDGQDDKEKNSKS